MQIIFALASDSEHSRFLSELPIKGTTTIKPGRFLWHPRLSLSKASDILIYGKY